MKTKKRFLPLRLAAATVLTLFFVFSLATNAEDSTVVSISPNDSVSDIQEKIQKELTGAQSGKIVTVTGRKTGVSELLTLDIPANVKVLWQAEYSDDGSFISYMIRLYGDGTFEVGDGGSISSSSSTGSSFAIYAMDSKKITIIVSGNGKVQMNTGCAIYTTGTVLVTGGEVSSVRNAAVTLVGGAVTVSGGTVRSGATYAILAGSGSDATITVTGGTVSSTGRVAIYANGKNSTVTVSGGLVFAYGSGITGSSDNVVWLNNNLPGFTGASGTGVVIAWNQGAGNTEYADKATEDIAFSPADATAAWEEREGLKGIAYTNANGTNTGFIPLIPELTGTPTITGTPTCGQILTANRGTLTFDPGNSGVTGLGTLSYQWKRGGTVIDNATSRTYTLVSEDVGHAITVTVTARNCFGDRTSEATEAVSAAPPTPYIDPPPTAANIYKGNLLSASVLSGGAASVEDTSVEGTFEWTDGKQEPGASGSFGVTFKPTETDSYSNAETEVSVAVLDLSALGELITEAESLKSAATAGEGNGEYTQAVYDTFADAITAAQAVYDKEAASNSQAAIDNAAQTLSQAITTFKNASNVVGIDGLKQLIQTATEKMHEATYGDKNGDYAPAQEAALGVAIKAAQEIAEKLNITPDEMSGAISDLQAAIKNFGDTLVTVDYQPLKGLLNTAKNAKSAASEGVGDGQHPPEALAALQEAIDTAQAVANDDHLSQATVNAALDELTQALGDFNKAIITVDFSALEAKLAEAKAIKPGNYITSTWDALQAAITGAETTRNTQHVTQEAVNSALDALISAINGLRHIYIPPPEDSRNNNNENDDAPEPSEEPEENPFDDVGQNDWFYEDVMFAYSRGLMTGTSARKFSPDAPMTRGMIVTILYRMESEPAARGETTFSDVADGKYYTGAVAWAEAEDIVDGYGNGLFGPEDDITRQDLALLFLRCARYKGLTLPAIRQYTAFIDDADVSDYARAAARTLYRAGIISGKPGNRLDPKGTATRAEVAAMLRRFLEAVEK